MKRKILGIMFVGFLSLFVVGCEKKKNEEKKEDKTPKIVCSQSKEEDGMKTTTTSTIFLRDDTYAKTYEVVAKIIFDSEENYKFYVEVMKNESDAETDEDVEYKNEYDDAAKTITTTLKVTVTDEIFAKASEEEKEEMKVKPIVESAEKLGAKCEFKYVTRGDIGL